MLEAMVSIFIMIVGVSGAMTLVSGGILNIGVAEDRLVAINLAQEGLEVMHNIRDTNWLVNPSRPWNDWDASGAADDCSGVCAGYVLWDSATLNMGSSSINLRWNGAHYDNAGTSGETFTRSIKITDVEDINADGNIDHVKVESTVGWGGSGDCAGYKYCVVLEERLYNWLQ